MTHSTQETGQDTIKVSGAVAAALAAGRPVVALESTIFSQLGLPAPANAEALRRCLAALREGGAEPAVTAYAAWVRVPGARGAPVEITAPTVLTVSPTMAPSVGALISARAT